jgi:hypothetical protein
VSLSERSPVIRVFVVYEDDPDPDRYAQHEALCGKVPGVTFRHGKVFGAPFGDPAFRYYAEMEFEDMDAFKAAARTPEFMATGVDSQEMGYRSQVHFAEVG